MLTVHTAADGAAEPFPTSEEKDHYDVEQSLFRQFDAGFDSTGNDGTDACSVRDDRLRRSRSLFDVARI